MDYHVHDSDSSISPPNKASFILFICAGLFNFLGSLTVSVVFFWCFHILSAISVLLIVFLNTIKVMEWYYTRKAKRKELKDEKL